MEPVLPWEKTTVPLAALFFAGMNQPWSGVPSADLKSMDSNFKPHIAGVAGSSRVGK